MKESKSAMLKINGQLILFQTGNQLHIQVSVHNVLQLLWTHTVALRTSHPTTDNDNIPNDLHNASFFVNGSVHTMFNVQSTVNKVNELY